MKYQTCERMHSTRRQERSAGWRMTQGTSLISSKADPQIELVGLGASQKSAIAWLSKFDWGPHYQENLNFKTQISVFYKS